MKLVLNIVFVTVSVVGISCDQRSSGDKRLEYALQTGDTNYVRTYLASGGEVNRRILPALGKRNAAPLLDYAIYYGPLDSVDFLLKNGADPNQRDGVGDTPLMWAIRSRTGVTDEMQVQIFKRLLEAGADPHLRASSNDRYTPLLDAALRGHFEIVQILIAAGADVNATNTVGQTALHLVDDADVAKLLIGAGANTTAITTYGETPLDTAIRRQEIDVVNVLTNSIVQTNQSKGSEQRMAWRMYACLLQQHAHLHRRRHPLQRQGVKFVESAWSPSESCHCSFAISAHRIFPRRQPTMGVYPRYSSTKFGWESSGI